MASVGELSVDVKARINDFSKNLSQALGQADSFASKMSSIGKKDYFAPIQETIKGMSRDFKQIIQGIVLAQTFYTGLQLFKQLTSAVYDYTDALNYAQVTFSNLFRDASLGEEFVAVLQQYAARSPFDFTDIEKGARQLSAYGIEAKNLMYVMEGIGNLSAVTGDPQTFETVSRAMGQIYSKGKMTAEEMRQLAEAGLNVKEVYARLGVEAGNVGKANISSAKALNTIVEVLNDTYAGALDAANTTMRGMLANTKDVILSVTSAVFQPAYEKLQRVLKWIQNGIDAFQKTFSTDNLAAAIERVFGAEALKRIQQFIAICQYLGNMLYQVLAPALRIVATYGETFLTVLGNMVRVIGPVVEFFAALLNTFLSTAAGAKMLQSALMALVVIKVVGGFASLLTNSLAVMSKTLSGVISVASAASGALTILTGAEVGAARGAYGAAAAWKYFTKTLKVNPLVMALTIILSLIAAVAGLRAMLGQTTDALAEMPGVDFSKFFESIKQATGDAEKFKQPFEDTGEAIDDANDELDKTKKKLEGLLSFDEVFKLPEKTDPTSNGDSTGLSDDVYNPTDFGAIEQPEVEPLDPRDWLPDITDILDWFKEQPWWKIGQVISNGIASGIKAAKLTPTKAVAEVLDDLLSTAGKALDKFNIKERIAKLAEKAAESREAFKDAGKLLGEEAYKAIEKEIGPEAAKRLKLKERLEAIAKEAAKGEKAWKDTGKQLAEALEKDLAEELGPEGAKKFKLKEQMESLAKEASKAEAKFAEAGEKLAKQMTSEIEKYLGPEAVKELKIAEKLETIAKDAVKGGKAWEEGGAAAAKQWLESLNKEFAKASIKGQAPEKAMVKLAKELSEAGVKVSDAGLEISDDFIKKLEKNFADPKSFGEITKEFGKNFIDAFKSLPKNISETFAEGFSPKKLFGAVIKSFTTESGESIFKAFIGPIKKAFTPAKIGSFLKTGLKDMGITIVGEMLFDELANWLDNNGMKEASIAVGKVGPILASALGTAIATKSPWGLVVGAIWGALFEGLGQGLENGDWSSFASSIMGALGAALSKIFKKGKGGGLLAVGSIISDLIFGAIADSMKANGDESGAEIVRTLGDIFSGALGGASIGMLFGPWGALAGALIGALIAGLVGHWDDIVNWWNNTAVPWFKDLPKNVKKFFSDADKWLSDEKCNPLAGLWNGIKAVWNTISKFFKGLVELVVGFLTGDEKLLHDAGYDLMDAFGGGILAIWNSDIVKFFKGLVSAIQGFIKDPIGTLKQVGKDVMKGLVDAATAFLNSDVAKFFGGVLDTIASFFKDPIGTLAQVGTDIVKGMLDASVAFFNSDIGQFFKGMLDAIVAFIKDPGKALLDIGNALMKGFKDGIDQIWKNITAFFSGILDWIIEHKGPLDKDRQALKPAGEAIINGLLDGIKNIWENVKTFILGIPTWIIKQFSNAINWLVKEGGNILSGLWNGISAWFATLKEKFITIPAWITSQFNNAINWLVTAGSNILSGLWNGINEWFTTLKERFITIPAWITNQFSNAINWLVTAGSNILSGLWNGINAWFTTLKEKFITIPAWLKSNFDNAVNWLVTAGSNILSGLWNGISEWFTTLKEKFITIPTWIRGKFENASDWLVTRGKQILSGLWSGISEWFVTLKEKFASIPEWIKGKFENASDWLVTRGKQILSGLWSGISEWFATLKEKFTKIPEWIKGKFENASEWLFTRGKQILSGLWSGISEWLGTLKERFGAIPVWIKEKFENAGDWLFRSGTNVIKGFLNGVKDWWSNIPDWFREVPEKIKNIFSYAGNWLISAGRDIISGLWDGLKAVWNGDWSVIEWLRGLPDSIKNIFSYASNWLWNAGWSIISGFWDGLRERWSYVTGWISDIGQWIADHKGPESYDRALLVPAGNWIMEGLEEGLQSQFQNVMKQVQSFGPQMEKAFEAPQLSVGRVDTPRITQVPVTQYGTQESDEQVANPYLTQSDNDASQRPIMYVGTLVADKQSLRELKKKLDIVETEQSRYR